MIYFPMTAMIVTPGHIRCLEYLADHDFVKIGLLTEKALKGYKKEIVPYKDRKFVLESIIRSISDIAIVPQHSLDPSDNIERYGCTAIASGDKFEGVELEAISRYNLDRIDIRLRGEKRKKYSSSAILERARK